jgi:anoctamin-10
VYLPTGLLATLEPSLTGILEKVAIRLTNFENYPTADSHEAAMIQKTFLFNLITGYLPVFLTAFVYIPFGPLMAPYLDVLDYLAHKYANDPLHPIKPSMLFQVDEWRLRKEVIYFGITAQIIDQFFEVVVPYVKHKWASYMKSRSGLTTMHKAKKSVHTINDLADESKFLKAVRNEIELEEYDVNTDLREMCMQVSLVLYPSRTLPLTNTKFGYLTNFSIVWPLTPLCFLVNNWIELRSDAVKICFDMRRPVPHRSDTIGPWLSNLGFLTGLGSINTAALIFLFSGEADSSSVMGRMRSWGFLATIIASEQLYFGVREFVRYGIRQLESKGLLQERRAQFLARKEFLERVMKVGTVADGSSRAKSPSGKKKQGKAIQLFDCSERKVRDGPRDRQEGLEKCLNMGLDIMRQQAPQEKKRQ